MGITVDEPTGGRWEAGLQLILAGEGGIDLPGTSILRCTAGVDPDPRVHVLIYSRHYEPRFITEASP